MRKITVMLIAILLGSLLLGGCSKAAKKPAPQDNPSTGIQQTTDAEMRIMASRFSTVATSVNGVEKATVVVAQSPAATSSNNSDALVPENQEPTKGNQGPNNASTEDSEINDLTDTNNNRASSPASGQLVAMVGLTINSQAAQDKNRVNAIKAEVKQKIMAQDSSIGEVLTTTNPDMLKRLQDIAAGVIQGQPFQSYAKDVNELDKSLRTQ